MYVLCAMPQEADGLVEALRARSTNVELQHRFAAQTSLSLPTSTLTFQGAPGPRSTIKVVTTGVGKVAMAAAMTEIAMVSAKTSAECEFVVNAGLAGWLPFQHENAAPIDVGMQQSMLGRMFCVEQALEADLDASPVLPPFVDSPGAVFHRPSHLLCRLIDECSDAPHDLTAFTQDKLVKTRVDVPVKAYGCAYTCGIDRRSGVQAALLVDMESAVFYRLANKHQLPSLALKVVSDVVGLTDVNDVTKHVDRLMRTFADVVLYLAKSEAVVRAVIASGVLTDKVQDLTTLEVVIGAIHEHGMAGDVPAFLYKH